MNAQIDVSEIASEIRCATLVMHCTGDRVVPIEESSFDPKYQLRRAAGKRSCAFGWHAGVHSILRGDDGFLANNA
jgi:hypothetical protein